MKADLIWRLAKALDIAPHEVWGAVVSTLQAVAAVLAGLALAGLLLAA